MPSMTTKRIELLVAPDGEVKLQTLGFAGSSCLRADQFLRDALGVSSSEELTPEYHLSAGEISTATESQEGGES